MDCKILKWVKECMDRYYLPQMLGKTFSTMEFQDFAVIMVPSSRNTVLPNLSLENPILVGFVEAQNLV